jgi:predicted TIM-barrel fold metal-dependent hydrolase
MFELSKIVGVDRVLFGSDYPHPEGLADPVTYVDALKKFSEPDVAKIMGGNLARLIDG